MQNGGIFPVDLSQYKLVHQIIEKIDRPEEKKLRLSVIAVPNDLILSYGALAVVYANSVLGARCNRNSGIIDDMYMGRSLERMD